MELVSVADIADLLDIKVHTVRQWRIRAATMRDPLPPPRWIVANGTTPVWTQDEIILWAYDCGRLPEELMDKAEVLLQARERGEVTQPST